MGQDLLGIWIDRSAGVDRLSGSFRLFCCVRAMSPSPDSVAPDKPSGPYEGGMAPLPKHKTQGLWTRTQEGGVLFFQLFRDLARLKALKPLCDGWDRKAI